MKRITITLTSCFLLLLSLNTLVFATDKPTVFVSILPQKYFVQQISMDHIHVEVMVQPGASPATYEPKPSQMRQLASSSAYFAIGVAFEQAWLKKIAGVNPEMQIVHTDEGITKLTMVEHHHDQEHHADQHHSVKEDKEHEEEHADVHHNEETGHNILHGGVDPHIWLSPALVKKQVTTIADTLSKIVPEKKSLFQENLKNFVRKIDALDTDLRNIFKERKGMRFMVFHPSWGYFAKDYGLEQIAIENEGKEPKLAQLRKLIEHAQENDINVIFVQPQFSTRSATVVAREINGEVIPADPLAENWLSNMRIVADKFKNTLK
jgi:zinc transport system substrate-binding protein